MIISASRRTDIPALYSEWFFNRLDEGFLYTQNPFNRKQVSKIQLTPDVVDCIVFWTKNPKPMLDKLNLLKDYSFYFQFTLTPYGNDIETNLPPKSELIDTFKKLSDGIGPHRVIWRYDPIVLTPKQSIKYHIEQFGKLAQELAGYTNRCVFSFYDEYRKCSNNMRSLGVQEISESDMMSIAQEFAVIGEMYGMSLETCAEAIDLESLGIRHGKCIDDELIQSISGRKIRVPKDKKQRKLCGCVSSIDIGSYDSCPQGCLYCYANVNKSKAVENCERHDPFSPLLIGTLRGDEKISERKLDSLYDDEQLSFL